MLDAIFLAEIFVQEHLAARNTAENVINARLETWLDVGVEKKRRYDVKKGRNGNVLLRDNLRGWVDSAAINSGLSGLSFPFLIFELSAFL